MGTGALLDFTPTSAVLWVCWGILAGILILALRLPEASPIKHCHDAPNIVSILRQPRIKALMAACFAMSAAHGPFYVFFSIHLADHGYEKTAIGSLWSLGVVAEIAVFMWMAQLSRRYSLRTILLVSFAAAVIRFLLMGWGVESLLLMLFVQLLHGLTFGAYHAAAISAVNLWFAGPAQARGQALYSSLSFGAGGLLGALISGHTWEAWGAGWTYALSAGFALIGGLLIWYWVTDETPCNETPAATTVDMAKRQK